MKSFIFAPDNTMREMEIPESLRLESLRRVVLNQFRDLDTNIKLIFNGTMFGGVEKDRDIFTWELGITDRHVLYVWDPNGPNAEKRLQVFLQLPARRIPVWDGTFSSKADEQDCDNLVLFFHQQPSEFNEFQITFPEAALAIRRGYLNVWFKENRPGVAEIEKYMAKYFEKAEEKKEESADSPDNVHLNPFEPCFFKDEDYEVQLAIEESIWMSNFMSDDEADEIEREKLKKADEELFVREDDDHANVQQLNEEEEELPELPLDMDDGIVIIPPNFGGVIRPIETFYPRVGGVVYLSPLSDDSDEEDNSLVEKTEGGNRELEVKEVLNVPERASVGAMSSQEGASTETPPLAPAQASKVDDADNVQLNEEELPELPLDMGDGIVLIPKDFKENSRYSAFWPTEAFHRRAGGVFHLTPERLSIEAMSSQEGASTEKPPSAPDSKVGDGSADDPDEVFDGAASLPLAPSQRGSERIGSMPFPAEHRFEPGSYFAHIRRTRGAGRRRLI